MKDEPLAKKANRGGSRCGVGTSRVARQGDHAAGMRSQRDQRGLRAPRSIYGAQVSRWERGCPARIVPIDFCKRLG